MEKDRKYYTIIDSKNNVIKVKEKAMQECFDKLIAPLDIYNQVSNETEIELVHKLDFQYVKDLENALIQALDNISIYHDLLYKNYDEYNDEDLKYYNNLMFEDINGEVVKKDFDYYDTLRELTNWGNYQALDFLDMFSDNEE